MDGIPNSDTEDSIFVIFHRNKILIESNPQMSKSVVLPRNATKSNIGGCTIKHRKNCKKCDHVKIEITDFFVVIFKAIVSHFKVVFTPLHFSVHPSPEDLFLAKVFGKFCNDKSICYLSRAIARVR